VRPAALRLLWVGSMAGLGGGVSLSYWAVSLEIH
jgi:hypothetical protein